MAATNVASWCHASAFAGSMALGKYHTQDLCVFVVMSFCAYAVLWFLEECERPRSKSVELDPLRSEKIVQVNIRSCPRSSANFSTGSLTSIG